MMCERVGSLVTIVGCLLHDSRHVGDPNHKWLTGHRARMTCCNILPLGSVSVWEFKTLLTCFMMDPPKSRDIASMSSVSFRSICFQWSNKRGESYLPDITSNQLFHKDLGYSRSTVTIQSQWHTVGPEHSLRIPCFVIVDDALVLFSGSTAA